MVLLFHGKKGKKMNRAGTERRNLSGEMAYRSFVPSALPPSPALEISEEMRELLTAAGKELAVLNALAIRIPDVRLFVSMYVRKEALLSSQIEGTQATLEDIFDPYLERNLTEDVSDVVNYVRATDFALNRLQSLPLCNRLLTETHAVLMEGVRGSEKCPGEFRRSQNWIGGKGCSLKEARYVPPACEDMIQAMGDLEKYFHTDDSSLDVLIRAALIHYQFETIHPFLDGNGRIGRLLITLFLLDKKILSSPVLYISYFLKKNRIEYYDRMSEVRRSGNYEQWVCFFLRALRETAADGIQTIDALTALHGKTETELKAGGRSFEVALQLFHHLESNPIITTGSAAQKLNLTFNTTNKAIKQLLSLGILTQTTPGKRNRVFSYEAYLRILREGT